MNARMGYQWLQYRWLGQVYEYRWRLHGTPLVCLAAGCLIAGADALMGNALAQQDFPNKPIRFISPYAPGGSTSFTARLIAQHLNEAWGQPVVVDNRPGANTIIGTQMTVKSQIGRAHV